MLGHGGRPSGIGLVHIQNIRPRGSLGGGFKGGGIIPGGPGLSGPAAGVALGGCRAGGRRGRKPPAPAASRSWVQAVGRCQQARRLFRASVQASRCHWVRRAAAQPCHNGSAGLSTPNSGFFSNSCAARPSRASASAEAFLLYQSVTGSAAGSVYRNQAQDPARPGRALRRQVLLSRNSSAGSLPVRPWAVSARATQAKGQRGTPCALSHSGTVPRRAAIGAAQLVGIGREQAAAFGKTGSPVFAVVLPGRP